MDVEEHETFLQKFLSDDRENNATYHIYTDESLAVNARPSMRRGIARRQYTIIIMSNYVSLYVYRLQK